MSTTQVGIRLSLEGAAQVDAGLQRVQGGMAKIGTAADSVRSALGGLAGAFAGAISVRAFVQAADAVTLLNNQLKLATGSTRAAGQAYEALFDIAQRSRVSFTELGSTYASIARAGESLGLSQQRLLGVTEAIGNAMTISGGSAAGMQAALTQLGQGLSSGTLRGEELNSVMEQTPRLARAIADGLGVTTGQLRAMGAAGQLTGEQVIKALEGQAATLRGEVADATLTVGQAMTQLQNATVKTVGEFDKASGASAALARGISELSGAVSAMGRAFSENETAIKTTLGVLAGVGTAAAIARTATALGGLAAGVGGVAGAVGALKLAVAGLNPVTLALLGLSAVAGGAAAYDNHWRSTADGIKETIKQLQEANTLAAGNLERMQGRPEVIEAINKAIAQRSQNIAELTAKLRAMNAEGAALNAPVGSVGSGDTALLRAQNADRATRQAALAKMMGELATPTEKLNKALADAKKSLGDLYSPEIEARIRARYIKPSQAAAAATDALSIAAERGAKAVAAIAAKDAGLSPEFFGAWSDLAAAFEKGRINLDQLTAAQAALLAQQPAMVAAAQAQAQAAEQLAAAEADRINALERSAASAAERLQQMQAEERASALAAAQNISLAQAIEEVAIARLREQQAALMREGSRDAEVLALQSEIDARKQIASAIGSREARAASEQSAKDAASDWDRTAQRIEQDLTDALMRGFESGKDFAKNLRDTVVNMFKTMVLRPVISAIVNPVAGALTGALGFSGTANAAGGGGGLGGMLSGASNLSSLMNLNTAGALGGLLSSSAAYGAAIGTASIGAGSQAAMLAAQTGTFGAAGVAATSTAAAGAGAGAASTVAAVAPWLLGAVAVASLWKPLFGRKLKDSGIEGTFGGESGFEGNSFEFLKGGLFRSNKTRRNPLDEATRKGLGDAFLGMRKQVEFFADSLGLQADKLAGYTGTIKLSLKGLSPEDANKKIQEALDTQSNELAKQVLGSWETTVETVTHDFRRLGKDMNLAPFAITRDVTTSTYTPSEFAREGELAIDTLKRLSTSLILVNGIFDTLGTTLYEASLAGADMASSLLDAFGGMDQFAAATQSYYANFYSDAEKLDTAARQLGATFEGLGITLPATKEAFRQLVEAQDLTTESGRGTYAALLSLSGAFAEVTGSAEQAARAAQQAAQKAAEQGATSAMQGLQRAVDAERQRLRTAFEQQSSGLESSISDLARVLGTLDSAIATVRGTIESTSIASQTAARLTLQSVLTAVQGGASVAGFESVIGQASGTLAGNSPELYQSREQFVKAQAQAAGLLQELSDAGGRQLTTAELQLQALKDGFDAEMVRLDDLVSSAQAQIDALLGIDNSVLSVAEAVAKVEAAIAALRTNTTAQAAAGAAGGGGGGGGGGMDPGSQLLKSVASYGAANGGDAYYFIPGVNDLAAKTAAYTRIAELTGMSAAEAVQLGTGKSFDEWREIERQFFAGEVPRAFAKGGYYPGGMALVGEEGPEIINFRNPGQVYTAGQTQSLLDQREVVAELRALRAAFAELQQQTRRTADAVNGNPEQPMLVETV